MDTMNSKSSGGKTTLYIVVFFLCVISAMSGYFYFTINSAEAEAQKKIEKIQASAKQELATAKSEAEKREIAQKAAFETAKAKVEATAKAKESALKSREAKIKAAEAAVGKKLRDASASIAKAKKYEREAAATRRKAQNLANQANAAMKKAIASGKAADMKVANEKKRLLKEYQKQVAAANKRVTVARNQAKAEARKALALKNRLNQITQRAEMIIGTTLGLNASPGYYRSGIVWAGEGPRTSNPKKCQDWAASKGYAAWGHRNSKHPNSKLKNTCFGYKSVREKHNVQKYGDEIHMVGCTFSDLRPDQVACPTTKFNLNASPGYYRSGIVWGGEGPRTSNPKVCQDWAARKGYAAWGHRNSKHPTSKYKNTCFGYKSVRAKYNTKYANDGIHVIGCTFSDLRPDQVACPSRR